MRFLHAADLHLDSPLRGLDRYAGAPVDFVLLAVAIHGRSFPDRAVDEDWVPSYPAPVPGCFNIVVLHTSQGGRAGHDTYAPTELATLCAKAYDYWALGHVHARELRTSRSFH